jgi:sirohydrochlorin cobaltochelatase
VTAVKRGLVLFAHGARDARWAAPFEAVAAQVRQRAPGTPVRLAYLESMAPTLLEAGLDLAAAGCGHVTVLPMFLGSGGHVRHDLPRLVDALRARCADVVFEVHTPIGEIASVSAAMADAALAAAGTAA